MSNKIFKRQLVLSLPTFTSSSPAEQEGINSHQIKRYKKRVPAIRTTRNKQDFFDAILPTTLPHSKTVYISVMRKRIHIVLLDVEVVRTSQI
jgi:hypothetical protein